MYRKYRLTAVFLALVVSIAFGLTFSQSVQAAADNTTTFYFSCDGTATVNAQNANALDCSNYMGAPLSQPAPGQTVKADVTCNGENDFLGRAPTPNYKDGPRDAGGTKSIIFYECTNNAKLVSTKFTNLKDNKPITQSGGGANTSIVPGGSQPGQDCSTGATKCRSDIPSDGTASGIKDNKIITDIINPAIKVFSILVGVVAVIMLIIAGILYSSAQDDPKRISLAKKIIFDVLIGIAAYAFLFAFLNYILPQGVT